MCIGQEIFVCQSKLEGDGLVFYKRPFLNQLVYTKTAIDV